MTGFEAQQLLAARRPRIEKLLRRFFAVEKARAQKVDPFLFHNLCTLERLIGRYGKRLRPILAVFAYEAAGGKDIDAIEQASLAVELFHNFLLIHDDVIDQDAMRHRGPSLHEVYRRYHHQRCWLGESGHFGESIAIVLGDIVASYCNRILISSEFPLTRRLAAIQQINEAMVMVGFGQIFDVLAGAKRRVTEAEILRIHYYKTAKYTVENPVIIGGIFGGLKAQVLKQLAAYAVPLGIAFQIQDDILGMFADELKLGKPVGSDLREGKQTLLVTQVWRRGSAAQQKRFRNLLGKKDLRSRDIEEARQIIMDTGSLEYSRQLARRYATRARRLMRRADIKKTGREFFDGVAAYIIERDL